MENLEKEVVLMVGGRSWSSLLFFMGGWGRRGVNCGNPLFEVVELATTRLLDYFNQ